MGNCRWNFILPFTGLQSQMLEIHEGEPVSYNLNILVYGILILVCYLSLKLFYVNERGKSVCILKKYEILPIRIQTFYRVKIRIMAETIFVLIGGSIPVHYLVVVANHHTASIRNVVFGAVACTVYALVFGAVSLIIVRSSRR